MNLLAISILLTVNLLELYIDMNGAQQNDSTNSFTTTKDSTIISAASTNKRPYLIAEASTLLGSNDTNNFAIAPPEESDERRGPLAQSLRLQLD